MSKFKNVKADLKEILESSEMARDNNLELYYYFLTIKYNISGQTTFLNICARILNKEIPTMDTVRRLSRQIQQQNPHLRGKNWDKRHGQQEEVKKDLGYGS